MKAKAVSLQSNKLLVQALIAAALAFVFSTYANAATLKTASAKKLVKVTNAKTQRQRIAVAATAGGSLATSLKAESKKKSDLDVGASLVIGTNQANTKVGKQNYYGSYTLAPSISHAKTNTSLSANLTYDRQYKYELDDRTDGDWRIGLVTLSKKIPLTGIVDSITISPRVVIGMGNAAKRWSYQGGFGSSLTASKKLALVTVSQSVGYTYNFYEYDIRDDGTVNSPHRLDETTSVALNPNDWLELQASFGLTYLRSFQGVNRTFSTTAFGASVALAKNVSVGIGAINFLRNTLEPSGLGNKVKLWDSNDAIAFIELGLSI